MVQNSLSSAATKERGSAKKDQLIVDQVQIEYFVKRTGEYHLAVEDITLTIAENEFVCIVGPSGCGKSTFLSVVAGLMKHSGGNISLNGKPITGPCKDLSMVFQSAALLPWRTVMRNVSYGIELWGVPKKEAMERAKKMITLVGLSGYEQRYPHELSGGMQQRVNLARALVADPQLLLLDEPFAALDAQTREVMQHELLRIWQENKKTALFITHQINEAIYLADRVVVLSKGPGRIKEIIPIEFPRPRNETIKRDPKFLEYEDRIWSLIKEESSD
jgi:NitT/TauT family transport system ATP-binding protein